MYIQELKFSRCPSDPGPDSSRWTDKTSGTTLEVPPSRGSSETRDVNQRLLVSRRDSTRVREETGWTKLRTEGVSMVRNPERHEVLRSEITVFLLRTEVVSRVSVPFRSLRVGVDLADRDVEGTHRQGGPGRPVGRTPRPRQRWVWV